MASGYDTVADAWGLYISAAIGDFVWEDSNANGKQDAGEAGIAGALVTLYDSSNAVVGTQTTLAGGAYHFTGLTPGVYHVGFAGPSGYTFTTQDVGANGFDVIDSDANTSTGLTGNYTLASGDDNLTVDAGLYRPAAIGDFVWEDSNANGKQDADGKSVVEGKRVDLGWRRIIIKKETTLAGEAYHFTGLMPAV